MAAKYKPEVFVRAAEKYDGCSVCHTRDNVRQVGYTDRWGQGIVFRLCWPHMNDLANALRADLGVPNSAG